MPFFSFLLLHCFPLFPVSFVFFLFDFSSILCSNFSLLSLPLSLPNFSFFHHFFHINIFSSCSLRSPFSPFFCFNLLLLFPYRSFLTFPYYFFNRFLLFILSFTPAFFFSQVSFFSISYSSFFLYFCLAFLLIAFWSLFHLPYLFTCILSSPRTLIFFLYYSLLLFFPSFLLYLLFICF